MTGFVHGTQGVTRDVVYLGALVYEPKYEGGGSCGVSANDYSV
jgi:hypothetical protein